MTEWSRIELLRTTFLASREHGIEVGIGDDAAVLRASSVGATCVTTDACVEGTHFARAWLDSAISFRELVVHAVGAAVSDVHAMGGSASVIFSSLILPKTFPDADFATLVRGYQQAEARYGVRLAGGNLARGNEVSLTHTVLGATPSPILRSGARVGDGIYVTGMLGDAALAVRAMQQARPLEFPHACATWCAPPHRGNEAVALRAVASAAIDISDGLIADLQHLLAQSGCGATLDFSAIPHRAGFWEDAARLDEEPESLLMAGGEDYELLFSARDEDVARLSLGATRIGEITKGALEVRGASQKTWAGFSHF